MRQESSNYKLYDWIVFMIIQNLRRKQKALNLRIKKRSLHVSWSIAEIYVFKRQTFSIAPIEAYVNESVCKHFYSVEDWLWPESNNRHSCLLDPLFPIGVRDRGKYKSKKPTSWKTQSFTGERWEELGKEKKISDVKATSQHSSQSAWYSATQWATATLEK